MIGRLERLEVLMRKCVIGGYAWGIRACDSPTVVLVRVGGTWAVGDIGEIAVESVPHQSKAP
jgi:hypothetical protein